MLITAYLFLKRLKRKNSVFSLISPDIYPFRIAFHLIDVFKMICAVCLFSLCSELRAVDGDFWAF